MPSQLNVDIIENQSTFDPLNPYNRPQLSVNGLIVPEQQQNLSVGEFIIGLGAADSLTSTSEDTIIGSGSANTLISSQLSTFVGAGSAYAAQNTATTIVIGRNAADFLNSGSDNTIIGSRGSFYTPSYPITAVGAFTGSNNIMIGANVRPSNFAGVNDEITLGNSSNTVLRCNVTTITSLSDERDKKEIETLPVGLEFVEKLKPVKFVWNDREDENKRDIVDFGFIAQDLKATQEEENASFLNLVYESNPDKLEASYGKLLPILVKAIQEMNTEIKSLKEEIETLKNK
jgi:hypothetical protein